jgi:ribonuclease BN (tRNA processing enzyme)
MSGLRLVPLGVGEAFSALHYTTSLAVGTDDAWLLIDCPHPIRKMMREASDAAGIPIDVDRIAATVITHLHADHSSGMEDFGYYSYFVLKRRAPLLIHPAASARLWEGHLAAGMEQIMLRDDGGPTPMHLGDYFDVIPLDEAQPVQFGPFSIECRRTIHAVPTTALRIRAGGRTLAFSADTAFDPTLIDWLAPADLIVHEVTFLEHTGMHTPYGKLAQLPEDLRARMRLIHYPDAFDIASSVIEPLRQGRVYPV